jgi:GNAT superfamily N-acetyltransferase
MAAQIARFRQRWDVAKVRSLTLDGTDIGWLQTFIQDGALFLGQLFVDKSLRGQGIATELVKGLVDEAASSSRAVTLGVVKTNPAPRLYVRLAFRATHDDGLLVGDGMQPHPGAGADYRNALQLRAARLDASHRRTISSSRTPWPVNVFAGCFHWQF